MNAVAAGAAARVENRVAGARSRGGEDPVLPAHAERERVDQDVAVVGRVEPGLAPNGRDADAVAVVPDASDDAVDEMPHPRAPFPVDLAEPQRIQAGDRPRAHREHVAQDSTHAGGGALVGLDETGVIVALHLEGRDPAVAYVDDSRVLARPVDDAPAPRREPSQVNLGRLVGAMLRVEGRGDPQLGPGRTATQQLAESAELLPGQAVIGREGRIDDRLACRGIRRRHRPYPPAAANAPTRPPTATAPARRPRPSRLPSISSAHRSGCGIRPSTLPPALQIPAIARSDPFRFAAGSRRPASST